MIRAVGGHLMWGGAGFKAWAAMEHYWLTHDRKYLAKVYPRLIASSRWQERERARTRVTSGTERPLTYGLMPRGMGDCGLMDDDDFYGVFLPHNIWAVYADRLSVQAAEILGKRKDLAELERIHESARTDLLQAIDRGAIHEQDYRWIPGASGKTSGSRWGALNACFPCRLLPADHELITGRLRHIEAHLSPGGIPVGTGWMQDGMWVAITLDNVAETQLARGNGMLWRAIFTRRSIMARHFSHGARNAARRRARPTIVATASIFGRPWQSCAASVTHSCWKTATGCNSP